MKQLRLFSCETSCLALSRARQEAKKVREATPIFALPAQEQPLARLQAHGVRALSLSELLVLLVGEPGGRLLTQFDDLPGLARANLPELEAVAGIGPRAAARIQAALEMGQRLLLATNGNGRTKITAPADAANLLMPEMGLLSQEQMRTVLLDTRNRILGTPTVYQGSLNTAVVRVGELFREAIRANAAAIIVAHNHPSGDPTPSPEDVTITEQFVQAGELLDINVLDHLIIGWQRYVSLKERGLGFG